MRNSLWLWIVLLALFACTDKTITTSIDSSLSSDQLPNSRTRYITLSVVGIAEDEILFNRLKQKLYQDHFSFSKTNKGGGISFNNCDNNTIMIIAGSGIVNYYAKSSVSEKAMKNTYADFSLTVFAFKNSTIAAQYYATIQQALSTSSAEAYCNHKTPANLLHKDNKIYYFVTRAEMFKTHTVKYANYIKNYSPIIINNQ